MAMDLITTPTTGTAVGGQPTTLTRTPDSDTETPPPPPHQTAKRVLQNHHHAPPPAAAVSYKECLKNHAASIGGHAVDGCCEFMPGPTFSPSDPASLKCAACGCHRNFHRRDPDDPAPLHHHPPATARPPHSPPSASQLLLSLSGQSPSRPSDEMNPTAMIFGYHHHPSNNNNNGGQNGNGSSHGSSRKRFRTKFSQEQKEKMYEFSEKIGWKLRKGEEKLVEGFCKEIGVVRGVFKVWMHNNKHSSSSSSSMRREKEHPDLLQLHHHHQQQQHNNNNINNDNNNNNGSCGSVVDHQFYASNGAQQEAQ